MDDDDYIEYQKREELAVAGPSASVPPLAPTLLSDSIAYAVSYLATTARISLRAAALVADTALEGAKIGTSASLGAGRAAIVGALTTARSIHYALAPPMSNSSEGTPTPQHIALFHRALEQYTNMSISFVNHSFTLTELFMLATFHLTTKTVKFSLNAAEETVATFDGLFGSTETSRTLATFVQLVRQELNELGEGSGLLLPSGIFSSTISTILLLGGLTKAITAYACLQYVTRERTMASRKLIKLYEGIVHFYGDDQHSHSEELLLTWDTPEPSSLSPEEPSPPPVPTKDADGIIDQVNFLRQDIETIEHIDEVISEGLLEEDVHAHTDLGRDDDDLVSNLDFFHHLADDFSEQAGEQFAMTVSSQQAISEQGSAGHSPAHSPHATSFEPNDDYGMYPSSPESTKSRPSFFSNLFQKLSFKRKHSADSNSHASSFSVSSAASHPDHKHIKSGTLPSASQPIQVRAHHRAGPSSNGFASPRIVSPGASFDHPSRHTRAGTSHWPDPYLLKNINRFVKFASAAYGRHFMNVFGIGVVSDVRTTDPDYPENHYVFSIHTGIPLNCILLSSYKKGGVAFQAPRMKPVQHFVCLDHASKAVVVTLRGTLGLSDTLTDLLFAYADFQFEGETYQVHEGMLKSAQLIADPTSVISKVVRKTLDEYPGYGVVLCGHSLGGGVAALVAMIWATAASSLSARIPTVFATSTASGLPTGRPIHCFAYGTPSVCSLSLSQASRELVTSVVNGNDLIPNLSIGIVKDLKSMSMMLLDPENKGLSEKIIGKSLGLYRDSPTTAALSRSGEGSSSGTPSSPPPRPTMPSHGSAPAAQSSWFYGSPPTSWFFGSPSSSAAASVPVPAPISTPQAPSVPSSPPNPSWFTQQSVPHLKDRTKLPPQDPDESDQEWFWDMMTEIKSTMRSEKLYPPGTVYWVRSVMTTTKTRHKPSLAPRQTSSKSSPSGLDAAAVKGGPASSKHQSLEIMTSRVECSRVEDVCQMFGQLNFSSKMMMDHSPKSYEDTLERLMQCVYGSVHADAAAASSGSRPSARHERSQAASSSGLTVLSDAQAQPSRKHRFRK
ncbi:uncharacterized protein BJ171DRAFT_52363 [Polychytrium aggregatum]|uniref:uncharacterized protein n=1 Tax=Polychytrium aggregatum TaxID=110093 RepID=UPI0022FDDEF3|nr:uncharacterized protein BJ171DRAFT_52363 [Polychytrium aggregatum]KAI9205800.1 hypothetical protein BJ171DRAFT_52363 [Polychytrium aggregatum]